MLNTIGNSTNTAYMMSAGKTNIQPIRDSRRTTFLEEIRWEDAGAAGRLSDVMSIVVISLAGA
jgi:hypothetical protein